MTLSMKVGPKGLALIKGFEFFVPYPYDDMVPAKNGVYPEWKGGPVRGTLTIGYGHTDAGKHPLKIKPGLSVTEPYAVRILDTDLDEVEQFINKNCSRQLTQGQFDALVSFGMNCGTGNLSNILRRVNGGRMAEARAALDLYIKSKGKTLRGLQRRRDAEQVLWDDDYELTLPSGPVDHPAEVDGEPEPEPTGEAHRPGVFEALMALIQAFSRLF